MKKLLTILLLLTAGFAAKAQDSSYDVLALGCDIHTNGQFGQVSPPGGLSIVGDSVLFYTVAADKYPANTAVITSRFESDSLTHINAIGHASETQSEFKMTLLIKEGLDIIKWVMPNGHEVYLVIRKVR